MVVSTDSVWEALVDLFEEQYQNAVVYGDPERERVLHEGKLRVRANGWVELPSGRLLSPGAIHHIDTGTDQVE